jgi:hypothetical protein
MHRPATVIAVVRVGTFRTHEEGEKPRLTAWDYSNFCWQVLNNNFEVLIRKMWRYYAPLK